MLKCLVLLVWWARPLPSLTKAYRTELVLTKEPYQTLPDITAVSIWLYPVRSIDLPIGLRLHDIELNTHIMDKHEQDKWDRITQWTLRTIIALGLVVAYLVVTGRIDTLIS